MRKIILLSMTTLDGVMQAPGGSKEDRSEGFKYGGWTAPYGDEVYGKVVQKELKQSADYLLGRKHLRFGKTTGLNIQTFGQELMTAQNMSFPKPGKSQTGKILYS